MKTLDSPGVELRVLKGWESHPGKQPPGQLPGRWRGCLGSPADRFLSCKHTVKSWLLGKESCLPVAFALGLTVRDPHDTLMNSPANHPPLEATIATQDYMGWRVRAVGVRCEGVGGHLTTLIR